MEILAIIPARGGSKSIPRKNILPVLGKPLVSYSIESALRADRITRTIVSTDDDEIARVARSAGAEVPFIRPKDIAGETTPDLPVFQHALSWLEEHERYSPDLVVHLWPTSPYRRDGDIDLAIELLEKNPDATCVRSVTIPSQTPFKMWRRDQGVYLSPILVHDYPDEYHGGKRPYEQPRQSLSEVVVQTGYVAVIRPQTILTGSMMGDRILPYFHEPESYTELDSLKDLAHTEHVLRMHLGGIAK